MKTKKRITQKQRHVLDAVCQGLKDDRGRRIGWLDTQQICDAVPYEVSIHSMKFTIRFLIEKGLCEKGREVLRRERWVVPIMPTDAAFEVIRRRADPRVIEHENDVIEMFL